MTTLNAFLALVGIMLVLAPLLVFSGSWLVWKIRGGSNIVRDWALWDAGAALMVTAVLALAFSPVVIWPSQPEASAFGLIPLAIVGLWWHRSGRGGRRMEAVLAYFIELRDRRTA
jgi:hypothetical protein